MEKFIDELKNGNLKASSVSVKDSYTATAKVGRDIIENAEYFSFNHSTLWDPEDMNKLEKLWFFITTPYYRVKNKLEEVYWSCRYGFERMFKGYDSVDTFETFSKFTDRYSKILTELRNCHYGYPGTLTEQEWDNILDEMIYHLRYMDEETVTEELEKDVPEDWIVNNKTVYEIMDKHKNEFFKLFSEYFYNMWD